MRAWAVAASLGIHAVVVGALLWQGMPDAPPREPAPIYFEIIEEAFSEEPPPTAPTENPSPPENPALPENPAPPENLEPLENLALLENPEPPADLAPLPTPAPPQPPAPDTADNHAAILSPPSALNQITPVYPRSARRKGREGCVTLEIRVSAEGAVVDAAIVATSGFADLDQAALDAAKSARFAPATEDDIPVDGSIRLTFDFKLR